LQRFCAAAKQKAARCKAGGFFVAKNLLPKTGVKLRILAMATGLFPKSGV
jgi:hypothetical protein